jgi:hypothetical protein
MHVQSSGFNAVPHRFLPLQAASKHLSPFSFHYENTKIYSILKSACQPNIQHILTTSIFNNSPSFAIFEAMCPTPAAQ